MAWGAPGVVIGCFTPSRPALVAFCVLLGCQVAWAQSAGNAEPSAGPESTTAAAAQLTALAVRIELENTKLTRQQIRRALADEFQTPVVPAEGPEGLRLVVQGRRLHASFVDADGASIERTIELPEQLARQLDAIALLSGNLARDEAGELLSELRAAASEDAVLPSEPSDVPQPPLPPPADGDAQGQSSESDDDEAREDGAKDEPAQPEAAGDEDAATSLGRDEQEDEPAPEEDRPELPLAPFSAALWGDITYPRNVDHKRTYVHLGAVHSEIGSLQGFAGNLFVLRNRARGREFAGEGAQGAVIWAHSDGYFTGVHGAALVATAKGGIEGVQASGIFSFQKNETLGGQLAGVATLAMSDIEGVQGGGAFAGTWGDIRGVQGSGAIALVLGDLEGVQLASGPAVVSGSVNGVQLGTVTFARRMRGLQFGALNVAYQRMDGVQIGVGNYAGDYDGTQVGLVNVGGKISGTQVGLLNVAKDVDGAAVAPVNIIPGIRNQVVTYASWSPARSTEAAPAGPLVHMGMKFLPNSVYSQLTFGIGAEAERCPGDLLPGDAGCTGNGVLYAPGFAVGGRVPVAGGLFLELDGQYQFEKAFGSSLAHRHAALGRAAVGYEFGDSFSIFAGGGPRADLEVDAAGDVDPTPRAAPHVFAGIQLF